MSGNDLIWLAVAGGAMLCAGLLGLLVAIEFLPRMLGREDFVSDAPRSRRPPTTARSVRPAEPLVSIPEVPRQYAAPKTPPVQRAAPPPPAPLLPPRPAARPGPPRLVIGGAPQTAQRPAPQVQPPARRPQPAYNLDFEDRPVGAMRGGFAPAHDEDDEDLPTVSIDRHQLEGGEYALPERD
jgi:hypothetical protein